MDISISNVRHGMTVRSNATLFSDGRVDEDFVRSGDSFISDLRDPRVQSYTATGDAPGPGWKADDYGFECGPQSICIEEGDVVLRTTINTNGTRMAHKVSAPYDIDSGQVDVEACTEGFYIAMGGARPSP